MSYVNRMDEGDVISEPAVVARVADYHDRVRWGPIISGLLVALATQLVLSAMFAAIGAGNIEASGRPRTIAGDVAGGVGIWSIIALLISLFTGGWVTARACGPMNRNTAILNGAILWATTLAVSSWLLASGVSGAFGVAASNAGEVVNQIQGRALDVPQTNVSAQQARELASGVRQSLWWFVFGSILGLVTSIAGAVTGARSPRRNGNYS
ncbi:hypothetical protein [Calothrix sp. PCC 6303]|uniref:hypothetical protein n=1 Tax=Calothrix sp. PCC 6303 TaxID=1170562 RepID=UPI0002A0417E|nr:hypothetical protein [Calothrix sp. PCC 6303]AFZ02894.1 hypothetical protein Cal6303_3978 [Calothrix sp. PCC 6303]